MDYRHHFHAGNVGDVWKHCALVAWIRALRRTALPLCYIETHAGCGSYRLGPTGEWTEGVGRLLGEQATPLPAAAARYLELSRRLGLGSRRALTYPGSPRLALALLERTDRAILCELQGETGDALADELAGDARAVIERGDGLTALPLHLRQAREGEEILVLIDPPYVTKSEWCEVPDAIVEARRLRPRAALLLWYPIKSFTRPDAMLKHLRSSGVSATALDLITTPLDLKRNRLNGSGVLLVNAAPEVIGEIAAAAPGIGAACATHGGRWFTRGTSWGTGE